MASSRRKARNLQGAFYRECPFQGEQKHYATTGKFVQFSISNENTQVNGHALKVPPGVSDG
jgi:hypothetical protein